MTSRFGTQFIFVVFLLAAVTWPMRAGVIYSTDGTATPAFTCCIGYGSYATANTTAAEFVAASSGVLSLIEVAGSSLGNGTYSENLDLRDDNSGTPGTVIDTFTVTVGNSIVLLAGNSTSHPSLVAGQSYWLEMREPPTALVGWILSKPAVSGTVLAGVNNDTTWEATCPECNGVLPAFALIGQDSTPEPSTAALALGAILGMIAIARKSRRAI